MRKAYEGFPIRNLTKSFLQPQYSYEMARKLFVRVKERGHRRAMPLVAAWYEHVCSDFAQYCEEIDANLWREAKQKAEYIRDTANSKLRQIDLDLGGAGNYPLLYFLVRHLRPRVVVETGVAAGFSSYAILLALRENGGGRLYSSDFPYFRIDTPEKFVGFVVDDDLRGDWVCLTKGDKKNLPNILSQIDHIDLFHYDSDKSYSGRKWALDYVYPRMKKGSVIVMDDINDNAYFHDFIQANRVDMKIFKFLGKYVGMFET